MTVSTLGGYPRKNNIMVFQLRINIWIKGFDQTSLEKDQMNMDSVFETKVHSESKKNLNINEIWWSDDFVIFFFMLLSIIVYCCTCDNLNIFRSVLNLFQTINHIYIHICRRCKTNIIRTPSYLSGQPLQSSESLSNKLHKCRIDRIASSTLRWSSSCHFAASWKKFIESLQFKKRFILFTIKNRINLKLLKY